MNLSRRIFTASLLLGAGTVIAQPSVWPTKPVRVVVGYGAGGPSDIVMRALGLKLSAIWGQPVIVENKPGGNEIIAAIDAAKQLPDGYTLIFATDSMFSLNPLLRKKPGYDAVNDFAPITRVVQSPLMLFVRPDFPADNLRQFIAYAKANPGKLNYATTGVGGVTHLAISWLSKLYDLDMTPVAYNAVPTVVQDLITSRTDFTMLASGPFMPYVSSGKVKALAVSSAARLAIAPTVPTFTEAGYPDYAASYYIGLAAPANTPRQILARIAADVATALKTPELASLMSTMGLQPIGETPDQFSSFLANDRSSAEKRVRAANLTME